MDHLRKCTFTEEQPAIANESAQDFSDVVFPNADIDAQSDVMISQRNRYPQRNRRLPNLIFFAYTFVLVFRGRGM